MALSPQPAPETTVFAGALGGVLRSTDSGENWLTATLPTPPPYVVAIAVSPEYESDGLVFAATMEDGVFRSWDRGASWAAWNFGLLDLNVYALAISPDFGRDETLYVGTESGIFSSTNGGRAWREVPFAMEAAPVLSLALSPGYGADGILLAGTEASGLFRSADRGASWQRVYEWDGDSAVNQLVVANTGSGSWVLMALAGTSVSYSRDGGPLAQPARRRFPGCGAHMHLRAARVGRGRTIAAWPGGWPRHIGGNTRLASMKGQG